MKGSFKKKITRNKYHTGFDANGSRMIGDNIANGSGVIGCFFSVLCAVGLSLFVFIGFDVSSTTWDFLLCGTMTLSIKISATIGITGAELTIIGREGGFDGFNSFICFLGSFFGGFHLAWNETGCHSLSSNHQATLVLIYSECIPLCIAQAFDLVLAFYCTMIAILLTTYSQSICLLNNKINDIKNTIQI